MQWFDLFQQMERFKVVERETKTKAYSKEGMQFCFSLNFYFHLNPYFSINIYLFISVRIHMDPYLSVFIHLHLSEHMKPCGFMYLIKY